MTMVSQRAFLEGIPAGFRLEVCTSSLRGSTPLVRSLKARSPSSYSILPAVGTKQKDLSGRALEL